MATRYELRLPTSGTLHTACNGTHDRQDRQRGTLPLLEGSDEILAWFRRRLGPRTPLDIHGPGVFDGYPAGSFMIIGPDSSEPRAYACPYDGPVMPHPGGFGGVARASK